MPEFFGGTRIAEAKPQVRDSSVIAPLITKLPVQLATNKFVPSLSSIQRNTISVASTGISKVAPGSPPVSEVESLFPLMIAAEGVR